MKGFRFQLHGLLRLRKLEEDRRLQELRRRQSKLLAKQAEVRALGEERSKQINDLRELETGPLPMEKLLLRRRYLNSLNTQVLARGVELDQLRLGVLDAQRRVDEAVRSRQAVERLRDRRQQEFISEQNRREQTELEEATRGHAAVRSGRGRS